MINNCIDGEKSPILYSHKNRKFIILLKVQYAVIKSVKLKFEKQVLYIQNINFILKHSTSEY